MSSRHLLRPNIDEPTLFAPYPVSPDSAAQFLNLESRTFAYRICCSHLGIPNSVQELISITLPTLATRTRLVRRIKNSSKDDPRPSNCTENMNHLSTEDTSTTSPTPADQTRSRFSTYTSFSFFSLSFILALKFLILC